MTTVYSYGEFAACAGAHGSHEDANARARICTQVRRAHRARSARVPHVGRGTAAEKTSGPLATMGMVVMDGRGKIRAARMTGARRAGEDNREREEACAQVGKSGSLGTGTEFKGMGIGICVRSRVEQLKKYRPSWGGNDSYFLAPQKLRYYYYYYYYIIRISLLKTSEISTKRLFNLIELLIEFT